MMGLFLEYPMYAGWFTSKLLNDGLFGDLADPTPLLPVPLMAVVTANERGAVTPYWPDNDSLPLCASDPVTGELVPVWKESRVGLPRFYWELAIRCGEDAFDVLTTIEYDDGAELKFPMYHNYLWNKANRLHLLLGGDEQITSIDDDRFLELLKEGSKCPSIPGFEKAIEQHNLDVDDAENVEDVFKANRVLRKKVPPVIAAVAPRPPRPSACTPDGSGGDGPAPSVEQAAKYYTPEAFKELVCDQENLDRRLVDDARLACIQRSTAGCDPIKAADLSFLATVLDNASLKAVISKAYSIDPAAVGLSPELAECRLDCTPGRAGKGASKASKAGGSGGGGGGDVRFKVDELELLAKTLSTTEFQKVLAKQYGIDTSGRTSAFDDAHIATLVDGLLKPKTTEGGIKAADVQILAKLLPAEQLAAVLAANYTGIGSAPSGVAFQANVNRFQTDAKPPTAAELETLAKLLPGADVAALLEGRYGLGANRDDDNSRATHVSEFRAHALRKTDPPPKLPTAAELETLANMLPPEVMAQFLRNTYEALPKSAELTADASLNKLAETIAKSRAKPTTSADIAALAKYLPPSAMAKLVRHSFPVLGTKATSTGAASAGAAAVETDNDDNDDIMEVSESEPEAAAAASAGGAAGSGGEEDPLAKGFQSALRPSRDDIEFMANLVTPETLAKFIKDPHAEIKIEDTKLRQHVASKRKHLSAEELEMALAVTSPGKRSDVLKAHYEGLLGVENLELNNNALETVTHRRLDRADIELLAQILSPAQLQRVMQGRYTTGEAGDVLEDARVENYARSKQRIPADELERLAVLMSPADFRNMLNASSPGVQVSADNALKIQNAAKRKLGPKRLSIDEIKTLSQIMSPETLGNLLAKNFGANEIGLNYAKLATFVDSLNGKTADMKVADILAMAPYLTTQSLTTLLRRHVDVNATVDDAGHQCLLQRYCKAPQGPGNPGAGPGQGPQGGQQFPPQGPGGAGQPPGNPGPGSSGAPQFQQPLVPGPANQPVVPQSGPAQPQPEPNRLKRTRSETVTGAGGEAENQSETIEALQQALQALQSQLSDKETDLTNLKDINARLSAQLSDSKADSEARATYTVALEADIEQLKAQLETFTRATDETTLLESAWSLSVAAALIVHDGETVDDIDKLPTFVNTEGGAECQGMTRSVACVVAKTIQLFGTWRGSDSPNNGFPESDYKHAWDKAQGLGDDGATELLKMWLSPAVKRMLADQSQYGANADTVIAAFLELVATRWTNP